MDENFLDGDFLSDLDRAFESIQAAPKPAPSVAKKNPRRAKKQRAELEQMQATFLDVTKVHLRPVLRYLKAIQMGAASKDLCEIVHYVIGPVIGKTRKVGLVNETKALIAFQRDLKSVVRTSPRKLNDENRTKLMTSFGPVEKGFRLEFRGHSTAVANLLGFYKAIRKRPDATDDDMKKLFSIGIPSLTMLRKSSIEELVSLSGLRPDKVAGLRFEARKFNILSLV